MGAWDLWAMILMGYGAQEMGSTIDIFYQTKYRDEFPWHGLLLADESLVNLDGYLMHDAGHSGLKISEDGHDEYCLYKIIPYQTKLTDPFHRSHEYFITTTDHCLACMLCGLQRGFVNHKIQAYH